MPNPFGILWVIFAAVWLLAAFGGKRTARRESLRARIGYSALTWLGSFMLIRPRAFGPLNIRFVSESPLAVNLGLALTAAGISFAIWARFALGRNWSGTVTVKENHELIQSGPYRFVRHPIYSGILLAMVGSALGYGRLPCLIGVIIVFFAFRFKWKTEESFMTELFGEKYLQYQSHVNAVIPGVY